MIFNTERLSCFMTLLYHILVVLQICFMDAFMIKINIIRTLHLCAKHAHTHKYILYSIKKKYVELNNLYIPIAFSADEHN